ncbi:MAG: HAD-IA family hydrolase [Planctomycetota bacterium]
MTTPADKSPQALSGPEAFPQYQRFEALVFDLDGTLADTMPAHFASWSAIAGKYGLHFPEDQFYAWGGRPSSAIVQDLATAQGVTLEHAAIAKEKELHYLEHGAPATQPIEPVLAIAQAFRGVKPMAIGTGGRNNQAYAILQALDIEGWFDAIVTADDVASHKPDPETFLEGARRLGADPARCAVFEDTDLGLQAGHAAGMHVVDIRELL